MLFPLVKGSLPFPLFQCRKQITSTKRFATLFGERKGVTTDEKKNVFIQIPNSSVCSRALTLLNCVNTFVHDCIDMHNKCTYIFCFVVKQISDKMAATASYFRTRACGTYPKFRHLREKVYLSPFLSWIYFPLIFSDNRKQSSHAAITQT